MRGAGRDKRTMTFVVSVSTVSSDNFFCVEQF